MGKSEGSAAWCVCRRRGATRAALACGNLRGSAQLLGLTAVGGESGWSGTQEVARSRGRSPVNRGDPACSRPGHERRRLGLASLEWSSGLEVSPEHGARYRGEAEAAVALLRWSTWRHTDWPTVETPIWSRGAPPASIKLAHRVLPGTARLRRRGCCSTALRSAGVDGMDESSGAARRRKAIQPRRLLRRRHGQRG
ncbi:formin-like protein 6 [Iris pallida]|uniref:Formin-like protein 6 n=1 Tax=Iris pallida TaxID=29817 RepID=A0AAX6EPI0_IRIPA|nr:formin-like protein 6 [Iris pallida]KAJ6808615.1 formin-like protein 6 [Iris pallida]